MRIAVWHNLPSGGGARALADQIRGLLARGHTVDVWTTPYGSPTAAPNEFAARVRTAPLRLLSGRRTWRSLPPAPVVLERLRAIRRHVRTVATEINAGGYDVVYAGACQFVRTAPLAAYVERPSVLYLGEPYRWLYEALPVPPFAARRRTGRPRPLTRIGDVVNSEALRIQIREEVDAARSFDRLLVNSYFSREAVLRAYGLPSEVCYLGVDTERFAARGLDRQSVVVGIGAFVPEKNIEFVAQAVAQTSSRPELWWIGNAADPGYLESVRDRCRRLGVGLHTFVDIDDDELVERLNTARVMAYAPRLEPFGFATVEAAATGLPVVALREGGIRETVVDGLTGYLVDDPEEMAARLDQLLGDEDHWTEMSAASRRHAAMSWDVATAVERLEAELMAAVAASTP